MPGKSAESLVVQASLHQHDMEMPPPNNKSGAVNLTPAEIAILKQWIDQGAKSSVQQERAVAWQPLAAGVHPDLQRGHDEGRPLRRLRTVESDLRL